MFTNKKKKETRGIELIDEVAGRFSSMIDELDQGVADCRNEQTNIHINIDQLQERDATLDSSVKRAAAMATNLRTLIGG